MTVPKQVAQKWGVEEDDLVNFVEDLWHYLVEIELLVPVTIEWLQREPFTQLLGYSPNQRGQTFFYRVVRRVPIDARLAEEPPVAGPQKMLCMAWHCSGEIETYS